MGYEIASQTTATAVTAALTTLIDWANVADYSDFRVITENTGGGSGDTITDVQLDTSPDNGLTIALDDTDVSPAAPIATGTADQVAFTNTASYFRIRAQCGAGNDTTAKCWLLADTLDIAVDTYALTTLAKVKDYLGITSTDHDSILSRLINAVTDKIEAFCGRKFKSRIYTFERQRGSGDTELLLDQWPIISVERVATSLENALQTECSSAGAYAATASITRTGDPMANTALKLSIHGGANDGDNSLLFATYTTLDLLAAAGLALAGWTVSVEGSHGDYNPTELYPSGSQNCLNTYNIIEVPYQWLADYEVKHEEGSLYRGGGWSRGWYNIIIDYTAGYETIPDDIEDVAIRSVRDVYNSRSLNKNLKSEKIGDYAYTLGDVGSSVMQYKDELTPYRRISVG